MHFLVSSFSYQKRTTVKSYQIPRSKVVRDAEVFFNVVPSSEETSLTTFYGQYFNHLLYIHILHFVKDLLCAAFHVSGTYCHKTSTRPLAVVNLDNRLYIHFIYENDPAMNMCTDE